MSAVEIYIAGRNGLDDVVDSAGDVVLDVGPGAINGWGLLEAIFPDVCQGGVGHPKA